MAENTQYQKTLLDDNKTALMGKPPEGGGRAPKMVFSVSNNGAPQILVYTNDPNDDRRPIRAAFDQKNWGAVLAMIRAAAEEWSEGEEALSINNRGSPSKLQTDSRLIVGRDSRGVVYLGLKKEDRPLQRFELMPSPYMRLVDRQGNELDPGVVSRYFVRGYLDLIRSQIEHYMREKYVPYDPQQQGGRNRQQNSGGGQSSFGGGADGFGGGTDGFDGDLPM